MLFILPFLPAIKRAFKAHVDAPRKADPAKAAARRRQKQARKTTRKAGR